MVFILVTRSSWSRMRLLCAAGIIRIRPLELVLAADQTKLLKRRTIPRKFIFCSMNAAGFYGEIEPDSLYVYVSLRF